MYIDTILLLKIALALFGIAFIIINIRVSIQSKAIEQLQHSIIVITESIHTLAGNQKDIAHQLHRGLIDIQNVANRVEAAKRKVDKSNLESSNT